MQQRIRLHIRSTLENWIRNHGRQRGFRFNIISNSGELDLARIPQLKIVSSAWSTPRNQIRHHFPQQSILFSMIFYSGESYLYKTLCLRIRFSIISHITESFSASYPTAGNQFQHHIPQQGTDSLLLLKFRIVLENAVRCRTSPVAHSGESS
jgi:hypothetical protein